MNDPFDAPGPLDPLALRALVLSRLLSEAERASTARYDPAVSRIVDALWQEYEACLQALGALPPAIEMPGTWTETEEVTWRRLVAELERHNHQQGA